MHCKKCRNVEKNAINRMFMDVLAMTNCKGKTSDLKNDEARCCHVLSCASCLGMQLPWGQPVFLCSFSMFSSCSGDFRVS